MDEKLFVLRFLAIALLIGALIGLEREYHYRLKNEQGFAGLRTFMFYSLLGSLATWISIHGQTFVLPVAFVGLIMLLSANYFLGSRRETDRGMTTEVAALLTFLLGSLVALGEAGVAVAVGVVLASLLSAKPTFLRWVERLTPEDIYTTLKFAVVAFVVFPILPDQAYGPWQALNPKNVWFMVVLISGVSFLGYIALKLLGPERGTAVSGLLGGLASSTAVAVSFSRRSQENPALAKSCAMAIVLASTVMAARIGALVAVVAPSLLKTLWPALAALIVAGAGASFFLWRASRHDTGKGEGLEVQNPFRLSAVLYFGAAYAAVLLLIKAAGEILPSGSTEIVAVLSGLTQVDAITLSVSKVVGEGMSPALASAAIVIAAVSNTVSKILIGRSLGGPTLRRPLVLGLGAMLLAGLAVLPLYYLG